MNSIIRLPEACRLLACNSRTLKRMTQRGEFPPPVEVHNKFKFWPKHEFEQALADLEQRYPRRAQ